MKFPSQNTVVPKNGANPAQKPSRLHKKPRFEAICTQPTRAERESSQSVQFPNDFKGTTAKTVAVVKNA